MNHLVLFDIDGTMLRVRGAGRIAFEKAFSEIFRVEDVWQDLNAHGRTDRDIIQEISKRALRRSIEVHEREELERLFTEYFADTLDQADNFEVFDGVEALLKELASLDNIYLGIETGNLRGTAGLKLKRATIQDFFTFGGFGCDSSDRSQIVATSLERGLSTHSLDTKEYSLTVIGDSLNDIRAGKMNNAKVIAVGTGGLDRSDIPESLIPDLFLDNLTNTSIITELILS